MVIRARVCLIRSIPHSMVRASRFLILFKKLFMLVRRDKMLTENEHFTI